MWTRTTVIIMPWPFNFSFAQRNCKPTNSGNFILRTASKWIKINKMILVVGNVRISTIINVNTFQIVGENSDPGCSILFHFGIITSLHRGMIWSIIVIIGQKTIYSIMRANINFLCMPSNNEPTFKKWKWWWYLQKPFIRQFQNGQPTFVEKLKEETMKYP